MAEQHVGRLEGPRRTGRARGHGHALEVERNEEALGLHAVEADVRGVRYAIDGRAVDRGAGHPVQDALLEAIAKAGQANRFRGERRRGQPRGDPKPGETGNIFRARPPVPLLLSTGERGVYARAAPDPEHADALRAAELVGRQRKEVGLERPDVNGNLPDRLYGVGVDQDTAPAGDRGDAGDRLDRPDLVIGVHDGHECGIRADGDFHVDGRHDTRFIDGDERRPPAPAAERLQRVQHRFVFDRRGHEMSPAGRFEGLGRAADGQVVGLGASAREHDFGWIGPLGLLAKVMHARRIAEHLPTDASDGVDDLRGWRARRVVVEVDTHA
jgi:hypothetical protein